MDDFVDFSEELVNFIEALLEKEQEVIVRYRVISSDIIEIASDVLDRYSDLFLEGFNQALISFFEFLLGIEMRLQEIFTFTKSCYQQLLEKLQGTPLTYEELRRLYYDVLDSSSRCRVEVSGKISEVITEILREVEESKDELIALLEQGLEEAREYLENVSFDDAINIIDDTIESIQSRAKMTSESLEYVSKKFSGIANGAPFDFKMPFLPYLPIINLKSVDLSFLLERQFDIALELFKRKIKLALDFSLDIKCDGLGIGFGGGPIFFFPPIFPVFGDDAKDKGVPPEIIEEITEEGKGAFGDVVDDFSPIDICRLVNGEAGNQTLSSAKSKIRQGYPLLSRYYNTEDKIRDFFHSFGKDFAIDQCRDFLDEVGIDNPDRTVDILLPKSPNCEDDFNALIKNRLRLYNIPEDEIDRQIEQSNREIDELRDSIQELLEDPLANEDFNRCYENGEITEDKKFELQSYMDGISYMYDSISEEFTSAASRWSDSVIFPSLEKRQVPKTVTPTQVGLSTDNNDPILNPLLVSLVSNGVEEEDILSYKGEDTPTYPLDIPVRRVAPEYTSVVSDLGENDSGLFVQTLEIPGKSSDIDFINSAVFGPQLRDTKTTSSNMSLSYIDELGRVSISKGVSSISRILNRDRFTRIKSLSNSGDSFSEIERSAFATFIINKSLSEPVPSDIREAIGSDLYDKIYSNFFDVVSENIIRSRFLIAESQEEGGLLGSSSSYEIEGINLAPRGINSCGANNPLKIGREKVKSKDSLFNSNCQKINAVPEEIMKDSTQDSFARIYMRVFLFDYLTRAVFFFGSLGVIDPNDKFLKKYILGNIKSEINSYVREDRETVKEIISKSGDGNGFEESLSLLYDDIITSSLTDIFSIFNSLIESKRLIPYIFDSLSERSPARTDLDFEGDADQGLYLERYARIKCDNDQLCSSLAIEKGVLSVVSLERLNSALVSGGFLSDAVLDVFDSINIGIRLVSESILTSNNLTNTQAAFSRSEQEKLYGLFDVSGGKRYVVPISSFETPFSTLYSENTKVSDVDNNIFGYDDNIRTFLVNGLSESPDVKFLFEDIMHFKDLVSFLNIHCIETITSVTGLEEVWLPVRQEIIRHVKCMSTDYLLRDEVFPDCFEDREDLFGMQKSVIENAFFNSIFKKKKSRCELFVSGLPGTSFGIRAALQAPIQIFKGFVESADPNISIASKIHIISGKKIPVLAASLSLLPANVIPFGIGPPVTPYGFVYLALFGSNIDRTDKDSSKDNETDKDILSESGECDL